MNVYLVENSPEIRVRLTEELERIPGVRVIGWAGSEAGAIEGIRRGQPDVAIVDLQLEPGSGLQVLNAILGERASHTKFVMCSNSGDRAALDFCLLNGALRAFDKTIEIPELLAYISSLAAASNPRAQGAG